MAEAASLNPLVNATAPTATTSSSSSHPVGGGGSNRDPDLEVNNNETGLADGLVDKAPVGDHGAVGLEVDVLLGRVDDHVVRDVSSPASSSSSSTSAASTAEAESASPVTAATSVTSGVPAVVEESSVYVLNDSFRLTVSGPEEWLCVARLPMDFTQNEFVSLLETYGPIEQCFLIHSEITGKSKGYGLVKYSKKTSSIHARHVLEGFETRDGHVLDCDWLKNKRLTEADTSLHSKCLYVDQLPTDYRDMVEFRKIFSRIVNPPYCQIAIKNGVIQRWGLVEYQSSQQAEDTLESLKSEGTAAVRGEDGNMKPFRVQYCIPGVHAINIYMAFVNNPMDAVHEKKALLEEAPSSKVYDQLNSLSKHNPWFVQNLQNIMASTALADSVQQQSHQQQPQASPAPAPAPAPQLVSPASADPAQAALILLLAGRVNKAPPEQTASLLQGIIKQMINGVNATEILKSVIPSLSPEVGGLQEDDPKRLIQMAINLASTSTTTTATSNQSTVEAMVVDERTSPSTSPSSSSAGSSSPKSDKCPLLMDLLYKSFQAKLAKEQRLKALQDQQQQQQQQQKLPYRRSEEHHSSHPTNSSTFHGNSSSSISNRRQPPQLHTHQHPRTSTAPAHGVGVGGFVQAGVASPGSTLPVAATKLIVQPQMCTAVNANNNHLSTAATLSPTDAMAVAIQQQQQFNQRQQQLLAAASVQQSQQQQPQMASAAPTYHQQYFSYIPTAAATPAAATSMFAATAQPMWPYQLVQNHPGAVVSAPSMAANVIYQPAVANAAAASVGIKRAAAPVLYANVDPKRMKMA